MRTNHHAATRRRTRIATRRTIEALERRTLLSTVSVAAEDGSASERGPDDGVFTVSRSNDDLSAPLTVVLASGSTGTVGEDFDALPASVTLPAGVSYVHLPVRVRPDSAAEPTENVVLTIVNSPDYDVASRSATVRIFDDDTPGDRFEPNDTAAEATALGTGDFLGELGLSIHSPTDVDYFTFRKAPSARGHLAIWIGFDPRHGDLNLALFDGTREVARSTGSDGVEFVTVDAPAGKTYTVKVWGEGGATNPSYDLWVSPSPNTPTLRAQAGAWSGNTVRFDPVRPGQPAEATVTLVNIGRAPLETTGMRAPAGFEVVDPQARTLAPGATDTVTIRATDTSRPGLRMGDVTFNSNEPEPTVLGFHLVSPVYGVANRTFLYNNSSRDNHTPGFSDRDLGAVAFDKEALLPGQTASVRNVSNYSKGINGVMFYLVRPGGRALTADDFEFSAGTGPDPATWGPGPDNVRVFARNAGNSAWNVALIWPDYDPATNDRFEQAVANGWLRVTMKANERTGLTAPDTSYLGNLIGDTGDSATRLAVNALDLAAVRAHRSPPNQFFADPRYDINRDGTVNALDLALVRMNYGRRLNLITPPQASAALPFSAEPIDDRELNDPLAVLIA